MISDEQLIERLCSSMDAAAADIFPSADLLVGISPARTRAFRLPSFGGAVALLATASALLIAALAVTSLGRKRAPTAEPAGRPAQPTLGPTSLAALRSELAILRRPQAAADRLPAWGIAAAERQDCSSCLTVPKLIPKETRLLATIRPPRSGAGSEPGSERVYLVVGTVPRGWGDGRLSGWRQHAGAIGGIHLSLVGLAGPRSGQAQPMDELLNPVDLPMPARASTPRHVMITRFATIGVVPDGVARVKWELTNPGQAKPITVYPRVRGNVAIAPWTPAPRYTQLVNEQFLAGATWYASDGRVIAWFSDLAQINKPSAGTKKPSGA
jgi:hypothetical protein